MPDAVAFPFVVAYFAKLAAPILGAIQGILMRSLYNLGARVFRRACEIPVRGLPLLTTSSDLIDQQLGIETSGIVWLNKRKKQEFSEWYSIRSFRFRKMPLGDSKFRSKSWRILFH